MLRASRRWLQLNSTKPCGPHMAHALPARAYQAFRSEEVMTEFTLNEVEQANMRVMNKKLSVETRSKHGLPRDLGELPRTYLLRTLFVNQPATQHDLWEMLKACDDCPFDSYRHLEFVLRVALHQNWVVREKNQADRKWYLSVHPQRSASVSEALQQEKEQSTRAALDSEAAAAERAEAEREASEEAVDLAIQDLQHQLTVNVAVLQEQDRQLARALPYVQADGSLDFAWYRDGGSPALLARAAEAEEETSEDTAVDQP